MSATTSSAAASGQKDALWTILLAAIAVVVVGILVLGGFWLQRQRMDAAVLDLRTDIYDTPSAAKRPPPKPVAAAAPSRPSLSEVQQTRQYLLNHPAVTPTAGFDKPGVQSTGKAIVQAMDQAQPGTTSQRQP